MITVTFEGQRLSVPEGTTYYDLICRHMPEERKKILLVQEGQLLRELGHVPASGSAVTKVTYQDRAGQQSYLRSLCMLLHKSVSDLLGSGGNQVTVHFTVGKGLYCTLRDPACLTEAFLEQVKTRMQQLVKQELPFQKRSVSTREAKALFHDLGMYDKQQLFRYRLSSRTNLYELDGFVDYYYGYMVHDTGYLGNFDLTQYQEGFVLRFPDQDGAGAIPPFVPDEQLFGVQSDSLRWGRKINILDVGDLNDLVVSGKYPELMMTQEAYHEKQIAQIAQEIAGDPRKKIILIAGPSSSGKTTFSHRLSTQLTVHGLTPHPIPMDDYFVNREDTPLNPDGSYNYECLEAIDVNQFQKDMTGLLSGERVLLPSFNFKTGKREYKDKYLQIGPEDILVIEGIHGLNDSLTDTLPKESKYKIYISALTQLNVDEHNRIPTTDGRLLRRIVRDARTRGTNAEETIAMWASVRRGEEHYIFPYQESADVMFNSALIYELAVLKTYVQPLLFGISEESPSYPEAKRLLKFLDYCLSVPAERIPANSLIREFVGGSCFDV